MSKQHVPKYHRQRFLVALLETAGGTLGKMDFQKLLFLAHQVTDVRYFDFVPYHYGCYSFQAVSDLEVLQKNGWLRIQGKTISLVRPLPAEKALNPCQRAELTAFMHKHRQYRGRSLVHHIYDRYPYFAIRSKMAEDIVDSKALERIREVKNGLRQHRSILFTIGYEGISFENYVNRLIRHDVRLLCDVRKNPLSRKFGFSRGSLAVLLPRLGIDYVHIPELGIVSQSRKNLKTAEDYRRLFHEYTKTLPGKESYMLQLHDLVQEKQRIAITCFEKEPSFCHRHCLADWLKKEKGVVVSHL